jgi:hypothetical protein
MTKIPERTIQLIIATDDDCGTELDDKASTNDRRFNISKNESKSFNSRMVEEKFFSRQGDHREGGLQSGSKRRRFI